MKRLMTIIGALLIISLPVTALLLYVPACNDKPTQPPPPEPEEDYRVWFINVANSHMVYTYQPSLGDIDSTEIPWSIGGLTASADGSKLYISGEQSVTVIDSDSHELVAELPYDPRRSVAVSPDGRYVAIPGDSLWILRTSDYTLVYLDTLETGAGRFSADSRHYYTVASHVRKYGPLDGSIQVTTKIFDQTAITQVIPTPDEAKWLMYARLSPMYTWAFIVYEPASDSVIFMEILQPGAGYVAMTPDGHYAFYGNPGTISFGPSPTMDFRVFDVQSNAIDCIVSTEVVVDSMPVEWFAVGEMVVTPDGKWLVAMDTPAGPPHQLLAYDLTGAKFMDYRSFGTHNVAITYLTAQLSR
ncbi:MAG: hypothetical protein ABIE70_13270 [bacterium]